MIVGGSGLNSDNDASTAPILAVASILGSMAVSGVGEDLHQQPRLNLIQKGSIIHQLSQLIVVDCLACDFFLGGCLNLRLEVGWCDGTTGPPAPASAPTSALCTNLR